MELEEYKKQAIQRLNKSIAFNQKENMYYACMGVVEETGEIVAELRKPLYKGNFHEKKLDKEEIKSELGDLMWYMALICENTNIDMDELQTYKTKENLNEISKREKLKQLAILIGKYSGKIVEKYEEFYSTEKNKEELIEQIEKQYQNICELGKQLDITIDEILENNINKINSRYTKEGEVNKEQQKIDQEDK